MYLAYFPFFGSSQVHLEPEQELFEVWEIMVGQIIITIIANVIIRHISPVVKKGLSHQVCSRGGSILKKGHKTAKVPALQKLTNMCYYQSVISCVQVDLRT